MRAWITLLLVIIFCVPQVQHLPGGVILSGCSHCVIQWGVGWTETTEVTLSLGHTLRSLTVQCLSVHLNSHAACEVMIVFCAVRLWRSGKSSHGITKYRMFCFFHHDTEHLYRLASRYMAAHSGQKVTEYAMVILTRAILEPLKFTDNLMAAARSFLLYNISLPTVLHHPYKYGFPSRRRIHGHFLVGFQYNLSLK